VPLSVKTSRIGAALIAFITVWVSSVPEDPEDGNHPLQIVRENVLSVAAGPND
jgi:hypothetical protein